MTVYNGTPGDDTLSGGINDTLNGLGGNDTLIGGGIVNGGDGNDKIYETSTFFSGDAGAGLDNLYVDLSVSPGPNTILFVAGTLTGVVSMDNVEGIHIVSGSADDQFVFSENQPTKPVASSWDGGPGSDIATVEMDTFTEALRLVAVGNTYTILDPSKSTLLTLTHIERLVILFGSGNDTIAGDIAGDTVFNGEGGIDTVIFSGDLSSYTISVSSNDVIVIADAAIYDGLVNIERIKFADAVMTVTASGPKLFLPSLGAPRDFYADGRAAILLQDDSGDVAIWRMNGTSILSRHWTDSNAGSGWQVIGTGDFSNDGLADILLQNDDGRIAVWTMNGVTRLSDTVLDNDPGRGWHAITTGDFNGDGKSDIVLQNDNGKAAIWLMSGSTILSTNVPSISPGPTWHIEGAGDFDGDGKSDIVWQNDNGLVTIWTMNGGTVSSVASVALNPGPTWHVDGTGDFNGDGKSDIVLQNDNGQVAIWLMNGSTITSRTVLSTNPTASWRVKGTADYDGDGKSDILLQNTNGNVAVWLMNGTSIATNSLVGGQPGPTWHVVAG